MSSNPPITVDQLTEEKLNNDDNLVLVLKKNSNGTYTAKRMSHANNLKGRLQTISALDFEEISSDVYLKNEQNNNASALITQNGKQYDCFYTNDATPNLKFGIRNKDGLWSFVDQPTKTLVNGINDFHNWAALGMGPDNILHCWRDMHISTMKYFRFNAAESIITALADGGMNGSHENDVTYPGPFNDKDGELFCKYRDGPNSGNGDWYLKKWDTVTGTWIAAIGTGTDGILVEGKPDNINGYTSMPFIDKVNNIAYFTITWRDDPDFQNNHDLSFFSYNMTTGEVLQSNGSVQTVPITLANADIIDAVTTGNSLTNVTNQRSVAVDSSGNKHVIYGKNDSNGIPQVWYLKHNGTSWALPVQITQHATSVDSNIQPAILMDSEGILYVFHKSSASGYNVNVIESRDAGVKWIPYTLHPNAGLWVARNIDLRAWDDYDEFYQLMQFNVDDDYSYLQRSIYVGYWNPKEGAKMTRCIPHGVLTNDDYVIKSLNGRIRLHSTKRVDILVGDLEITIPDDVIDVGLKLKNTDGHWYWRNATANVGEFSPRQETKIVGAGNSEFHDVISVDDSDDEPVLKYRIKKNPNSDLSTRDLVQWRNNATEYMRLKNGGNLELSVNGKGLILNSPNGTRYVLTVDNAGALVTTAL